ncbi:MAG: hypothetical protein ACE5E1_01790 [Phycisphaerae bacterium]
MNSGDRPRRALILVVVLIMIVLLSLLAAGYTFMVRAHLNTVIADMEQFQARMAAEAGAQRAIVALRETRGDVDSWFDNPEDYRAALVWGEEGDEGEAVFQTRSDARTYDSRAEPAWRFTLYAPNTDDPDTARYGFTDESARLDLNVATEAQIRRLFEMVIPDDPDNPVELDVLVDSLFDWRTRGTRPREHGAKDDYYLSLDPPYRCKSADFSTVEELLLVRGFTAWVVYGEDYNQNGLLDPNEDDGDVSFPPDDANGELFRGVAPYLTVWSMEMNTSGDNRPRIHLNLTSPEDLEEKLQEESFNGDLITYIIGIRSQGGTFPSVMNLLPAPEADERDTGSDQPPVSTQPTGDAATSQPDNGNADGSGGGLTDQDGANGTSENQPSQPAWVNLTDEIPPGTEDDLPLILDRLTTDSPGQLRGRINVSTAPREVLAMIDELTEQELDALVETRKELPSAEKSTPAWLLTKGIVGKEKFYRILPKITTKSSRYRIESVGYADHVGVISRIMMVIEMRGPIPQVLYYRNLDRLGPAYTPYGEERRGQNNRSG